MEKFAPDIAPRWPQSRRHGIGIIGAGGVVRHGHLPAYRSAGFNVVAIASRHHANALVVAEQWQIAHAAADWAELIDRPDVAVVDVAYPFDEQRLRIVEHAARRGKHVLMQKPLAHSMECARRMVEIARAGGILLAVNQNARWCPHYRAARVAIEQGWIGRPFFVTHQLQNKQDSQPWFSAGWYAQVERFQILEYMVHHLDLARFWLGMEPARVRASIGRKPTQHARGELIASVQLEFENGALAVVTDNNAAYPSSPPTARFVIEGTAGVIEGQAIAPSSFLLRSDRTGGESQVLNLSGSWFPDAFAGTMGELLCAIEDGRAPSLTAEDNLNTLRLVFAAYEQATT